MIAQNLIAASAAIVLLLGTAHLILTYASTRFSPRDAALEERLKWVSPRISDQTTMWRAATGFHASHSLGAILFGAVYGNLALYHYDFLLQEGFLAILGGVVLAAYLVLAKLYWFAVPLAGIALALTLYLLGFWIALA
jgi:hypothetical protein